MTSINNETLRKEIEQLTSNFPLFDRAELYLVLDYLNRHQLVKVKEIVSTIAPKIQLRSRYNDPMLFEPLSKFLKELVKLKVEKQKAALRHNKRFKHNVKKA